MVELRMRWMIGKLSSEAISSGMNAKVVPNSGLGSAVCVSIVCPVASERVEETEITHEWKRNSKSWA